MILVTGATGFVGGAVIQALLANGHEVVAAVRHLSSDFCFVSKSIKWREVGTINAQTQWAETMEGVNTVVHCAARVHVMREHVPDALAAYREVNVQGTLRLAQQAAAAGVLRFVFLSSIKVNGEATLPGLEFNESCTPAPLDAYGQSKLEAELALLDLADKTDMEVVIVRSPLVYGPGVKGNFASMVYWIRKGIPLPFGSIYNRRSLLALDNLVDFIVLCSNQEHSPRATNETFLLSDGEDVSTAELLRKVAEAYNVKPRLIPVPTLCIKTTASLLGKSAIADRLLGSLVVNSSKARELLGWKPVISMNKQLQKMAICV
jgi:nucleoside-diphosphate-sugar epimerase